MAVLRAIRGDDFQTVVFWKDPDGVAINLTGYTCTFVVTVNGTSTTYSSGTGLTVTPLTGRIDILVPHGDSDDWGTSGRWRMVTVSAGGLITTIVRGVLWVT